MSYDHETGLCAIVDEAHRVYLGWNIDLHPDDPTGEEFMNWIIDDRYDRPQRWRVLDGRDGSWTAWRLIPEYDDDEYGEMSMELDDSACTSFLLRALQVRLTRRNRYPTRSFGVLRAYTHESYHFEREPRRLVYSARYAVI